MIKRHVVIPVCIALISGAFIAVCTLICLTGARPALIKKKLKLGAILIYLTGLVSCDLFGGKPQPTCYVPLPPPNEIHITEPAVNGAGIELDLSRSNVLKGVIERREGTEFSFRIEDPGATERQRDDLAALDGAFDEFSEDFALNVRNDLETGEYFLRFFGVPASGQAGDHSGGLATFRMSVTGGEGSVD
jgi:hypothetical protein